MSGVEIHRVRRAFTTVAFEAVDRVQKRQRERFHIGLAEYTEEWHVAATGFVAGGADFVSADATIEFSMDFFDAPEQRRSDLLTPTFHFGSFQPVESPFVVATAAVREWTQRSDQAFIGAVVSVGVHSPGAAGPTEFDVLMHLSFSGFGAPYDLETANESDTDGGSG